MPKNVSRNCISLSKKLKWSLLWYTSVWINNFYSCFAFCDSVDVRMFNQMVFGWVSLPSWYKHFLDLSFAHDQNWSNYTFSISFITTSLQSFLNWNFFLPQQLLLVLPVRTSHCLLDQSYQQKGDFLSLIYQLGLVDMVY